MSAVRLDGASLALGRRNILSQVSFAIEAGEFVAVMGPNGAGKTTLMRAILGLVPAAGGRLEVLGAVPRRGNPAIGYMPQSRRTAAQLVLTGFDFLLSGQTGNRWGLPLATAAARAEVEAALDRVGATDLSRRPLTDLSGGERQRLFIAQALIGTPQLLLLDEPLISLDAAHQRAIVELVRDIATERKIAVLFSAHEINPLLRAVDRVLYLGSGHAAIGTVDEVIDETILSALYRTEVRVIRTAGRIFVIAEDGSLDSHDHQHEHGDEHLHEGYA